MNEQFVYLKLVTGEQLMAVKESEDDTSVTLKFPMVIRTHLVSAQPDRVSEQVTAGPYSLFAESPIVHVNKSHIVLDTKLADRAIVHYIHLVRDHEGVRLDYTPPALQWDDEPPEDAPTHVDVQKVLEQLKAITGDIEEEEIEKVFIDGNDTVH